MNSVIRFRPLLIALLLSALAARVAGALPGFSWQEPIEHGDIKVDRRGNVYSVSTVPYGTPVPPVVRKFGLFGNRIWETDVSSSGFTSLNAVLMLPGGDPVVFGTGAPAAGGQRNLRVARLHAADGTVVWATTGGYSPPEIQYAGVAPTNNFAVAPSGTVLAATRHIARNGMADAAITAWAPDGRLLWHHEMPEGYNGGDNFGPYVSVSPTGAIWAAQNVIDRSDPFNFVEKCVCRRLDPATGLALSETHTSAQATCLLALASGAVLGGWDLFRVAATGGVRWSLSYRPWQDIPDASIGQGYGPATLAADSRTGDIYFGVTSGNYADDDADGEVNGFAIVKISDGGELRWQHRWQTTDVTMRAPLLAFDAMGSLVVAGRGSRNHSRPNAAWGRLFRLSPQGTAHAIVEPVADFRPLDMELNLGLFPVLTGSIFRETGNPAMPYFRGGLTMQTPPPMPKGPFILAPPRVTIRDGRSILAVTTVGGHPPFQWQWYRNDRPIPGPEGTAPELPVGTALPASYYVEVRDRSGGSVSAVKVVW